MGAKQSSSSGDLAVQQQNRESVDSDPVHRSPWAIEARVTTGERSQSRDRPVSASFIRSRRYRERMSDDSDLGGFAVWEPQSLPTALNMLRYDRGIKCPVCSKKLTSDVLESHLAECLAKPRLTYNGDLTARLPCLCLYHKHCIEEWFSVSRCCPAHPETSTVDVDIPAELR